MKSGKIFYLMGKSSSGKDTIYKRLREDYRGVLGGVVPYTTRPERSGEQQGRDYHFVSEETYRRMKDAGRILEERAYDTVHGIWRYFTADDKQLESVRSGASVLMVGTLESYCSLKKSLGSELLVPLYIEVEDYLRLSRALEREKSQKEPSYREMCRRFLADCEDFSEEKIAAAGIEKRFENVELDRCLSLCREEIDSRLS